MTDDYEYLREHWKSMAQPVVHPEESAVTEDQTSLDKDEPSE